MKKYKLRVIPPIGDNDYLKVIEENNNTIVESVEDLFALLPSELPVNDILTAKLSVDKISNTCWLCSYKTWKNVTKKDFEKINILFTQAPSLKLCLYNMWYELHNKGIVE